MQSKLNSLIGEWAICDTKHLDNCNNLDSQTIEVNIFNKGIFSNLDDKSLTNCREASRRLKESLDKERLLWLRIIKHNSNHFNEHSKLWKKGVEKTPVEILKYLAIAIDQFFN